MVNIGAFGKCQRILWKNGKIKLGQGNSLACAHMTGIIYNFIKEHQLSHKKLMKILIENSKMRDCFLNFDITKKTNNKPPVNCYNRAVLFPFNKEMHSLICFEHLLPFEIEDIYDIKYSGHVNASVNSILVGKKSCKNFTIKNIEKINWDSFDTLILGHTSAIQMYTKNKEFVYNLINEAIQHNKYVYSFDFFRIYNDKFYFPKIDKKSFVKIPYGKLYSFSKPILAVFGTSSNQGKHTLQLELKERFQMSNYKVGHFGTEPTDYLLQADECYHFGYESNIKLNEYDKIKCINYLMHRIDQKDIDIIITGCQSGTITHHFGNIDFYTINQNIFLYGVLPDAIVLMINPDDENWIIKRTINFLESAVDCKVISLVVYPMKYIDLNKSLRKRKISCEEFIILKNKLQKHFSLPIYFLDDMDSIDDLFSNIIDFFIV